MIIRLESALSEDVEAAKRSLDDLAHSWGHEIAEAPEETTAAAGTTHANYRGIDPLSAAALVLSVPPAALAVVDLGDRIRKRRRAKELIDHAEQLAAQQVTVYVIAQSRTLELRGLSPDQLLDLTDEDPAS